MANSNADIIDEWSDFHKRVPCHATVLKTIIRWKKICFALFSRLVILYLCNFISRAQTKNGPPGWDLYLDFRWVNVCICTVRSEMKQFTALKTVPLKLKKWNCMCGICESRISCMEFKSDFSCSTEKKMLKNCLGNEINMKIPMCASNCLPHYTRYLNVDGCHKNRSNAKPKKKDEQRTSNKRTHWKWSTQIRCQSRYVVIAYKKYASFLIRTAAFGFFKWKFIQNLCGFLCKREHCAFHICH